MPLRKYLFIASSWLSLIAATAQPPASLVPTTPSAAPDYYCTWNLQGYVCSYGAGAGSNDLRLEINEDNLFGSQLGFKVWGHEQLKTTLTSGQPPREVTWTVPARYQGWLNHYPMLHADLTFVMDDSWDIPRGPEPDGASKRPHGRNYDNEHLATMSIDATRFPSFRGDDQQRMTQLVKAVKAQGWRSLGGWVCAQDPIGLTREYTGLENTYENSLRWTAEQEERFWKRRLSESQRAGFDYWKVDWGNKDRDEQFRRRLSQWGREVAPDVVIEHASFQDGGPHHPDFISFSQTIRSYDVNNQIAQAQTLQRLYDLGQQPDAEREGWGIINCEDEAYIAAGLGCAIGVMRHPYVGALPNGRPDTYFVDCGPGTRQLKNRLNEIARAVRWHRIAQPFGHQRDQWQADTVLLSESGPQGGASWEAPARISRRMPLPEIIGDGASAPDRPYVLASLYDNECVAVAIINRNINGVYQQQHVDVCAQPLRWDRKVGVFGHCRSLTLSYQGGLPTGTFTVYAQDLATDDAPTAIPYTLTTDGRGIILQGADLEALCQGHDYPYTEVEREAGKDYADQSDPAVVLLIKPETSAASAKNRGLDHLNFFYAGESTKHRMYIVRDGRIAWSYFDPEGRGEISDAVLLSDGHILMAHQHGIREVVPTPGTADGYTVAWQMDTPKGYEIHSIQPIGRDKIVYIQCGDPFTCVVREIPSMKLIREFKLPMRDGGSHGQMRCFRLTRRGTLLLASMQYGAIIEFDSHGRELRRLDLPGAWGVEELKNGNILGCSNRGFAREYNKKGEVVWEFDWSKNPAYKGISTQKAHRLPNGNTLMNNWFNEWSSQRIDPDHPDVQAIEVAPDGRIVWELSSWFPPADLGPATTIQPLDEPVDRTKMRFGDIK